MLQQTGSISDHQTSTYLELLFIQELEFFPNSIFSDVLSYSGGKSLNYTRQRAGPLQTSTASRFEHLEFEGGL
jgi:hypothetical protein